MSRAAPVRRIGAIFVGWLLLVAAWAAPGLAAPAAPTPLAIGSQVDWAFDGPPRALRYRAGEVTLRVRAVSDPETPDLFRLRMLVEAPGRRPQLIESAPVSAVMPHRFGIGRFDRAGTPFVYVQSYTGGAHCCTEIRVAIVEPERIRLAELGAWDGEPSKAFPKDVDGDGMVDFVQTDDRFRYRFASGAGSRTPPQVLNVVDGAVVDVSTRPGFRPLFAKAMREFRRECRDDDGEPNGACAAYAASAARAGRFEEAWAEMLREHDRGDRSSLPEGCRLAGRDDDCPEASVIHFRDYPEALRHFLVGWGYLPR